MKKLLILLFTIFLSIGSLSAQSADDIKGYIERANKGNSEVQLRLGVIYYNGRGVPRDFIQAMKYYRLAADQGDELAQFNLGLMYLDGEGVPKDDVEAAKWFRLAADQGFARAQRNLGYMYRDGLGVPQDFVQAHMWTNLAATQGSEVGKKIRDSVEKSMTPQQIAQAQELARNWKIKKEPTWDYNRMYPSQ